MRVGSPRADAPSHKSAQSSHYLAAIIRVAPGIRVTEQCWAPVPGPERVSTNAALSAAGTPVKGGRREAHGPRGPASQQTVRSPTVKDESIEGLTRCRVARSAQTDAAAMEEGARRSHCRVVSGRWTIPTELAHLGPARARRRGHASRPSQLNQAPHVLQQPTLDVQSLPSSIQSELTSKHPCSSFHSRLARLRPVTVARARRTGHTRLEARGGEDAASGSSGRSVNS